MPTLEELQRETSALLESPLERLQQETTVLLGAPLERPSQGLTAPPTNLFDPVSAGIPPVQEADFVPDPTSRPIAETQERALGGIDRFFGVPESFGDAGIEQVPRAIARAGVGAVGFLPTLAEGLIRPPEGQTTLDVAGEAVTGAGGMLARFIPQMRLLALKGIGADPNRPLNPADKAFISLIERVSGKTIEEFNRELETGLLEAPEETIFAPLIAAGGIRGGAKLTKRLQKVKEPPPTIIEEPTAKVTLPKARPEVEKLPIQEVPKEVGLLIPPEKIGSKVKRSLGRLAPPTKFEAEVHQRYLTITRNAQAETFLGQQKTREWKKKFTTVERENAGAIIEKIHNLKTGEVPKRTGKIMGLVRETREFFEKSRQKVNDFVRDTGKEEYISFLESYIPHFYADGKAKITGAVKSWLNSPNAKRRKIPTLKEAIDLGLTPISQDVAVLGQMWTDINWKVAANIKTADLFKNLRHPETRKKVVVSGEKPAPDWKFYNHPALNKTFGRKVGEKILLEKRGGWVPPDIQRTADWALTDPLADRGRIARAYDLANAYAKTGVLTFSGFHAFTLIESGQAVLAKAKNPIPALINLTREGFKPAFRLGKELERKHPELVADFIRDGLQLGEARADVGYSQVRKHLANLEAKTRNNPLLKWPIKIISGNFKLIDKVLWENIHEGSKIWGFYKSLEGELIKLPSNATPEAITAMRRTIAETMNDAFGGQEWRAKLWVSPKGLQFARRVMLAPDWTLSNINIAGKTALQIKNPTARRLHYKYWRNMALSVFSATQALNYWSTGNFTWDNEVGHKTNIDVTKVIQAKNKLLAKLIPGFEYDPNDKQRYYVRIAKQAREVFSWLEEPDVIFGHKTSPIAREVIRQIWNADPGGLFPPEWTREDLNFFESIPLRIKSMAETFTPFSLRGNNFAFSLPMSRGMTNFKAIRAYQRALEGKTWRVLQKIATKEEAIRAITEAAVKNGLNAKQLFASANGSVRGKYYTEFWKAWEKQDQKKMNEIGKILKELGVTGKQLEASAQRRGIK